MEKYIWQQLKTIRPTISVQLYRTIKGQIKAGDYEGALKGITRIKRRRQKDAHCDW